MKCHTVSSMCSHCGWLLLKCSAVGIGFTGAKPNNYCGFAHILGILLMNSCNTDIFFSNYYNYILQSVDFELKCLFNYHEYHLYCHNNVYSTITVHLYKYLISDQKRHWLVNSGKALSCNSMTTPFSAVIIGWMSNRFSIRGWKWK